MSESGKYPPTFSLTEERNIKLKCFCGENFLISQRLLDVFLEAWFYQKENKFSLKEIQSEPEKFSFEISECLECLPGKKIKNHNSVVEFKVIRE